MIFRRHHLALACLPLALAACGQKKAADRNIDSLDAELTGNTQGNSRDPAMTAALQDQIMVDPALAGQANNDALRPPHQPYSGAAPRDSIAPDGKAAPGGKPAPAPGDCPKCKVREDSVTLGALARRQADRRTSQCAGGLKYSTGWVQRLPADIPLYPDARVDEAAGSSDGNCALRVVSFSTGAPVKSVVDWYYGRVTKAGYTAEHQADGRQHVLGGTRGRDGGAYVLYIQPRGDGRTEVDLITNNGT